MQRTQNQTVQHWIKWTLLSCQFLLSSQRADEGHCDLYNKPLCLFVNWCASSGQHIYVPKRFKSSSRSEKCFKDWKRRKHSETSMIDISEKASDQDQINGLIIGKKESIPKRQW